MQKIGEQGLQIIKQFEGLRLQAYLCPADVWTIGYGHTATAKQGMVITEKQATDLLRKDVKRFEACVRELVPVPLSQEQFDALVSFVFNVGCGGLQITLKGGIKQDKNILRLLKQLQYKAAADELLRWNKAKGKVIRGLTRRREAERTLFLSGTT